MSEWRFVNRPVIVGITTDGQASLLFQVLPPGDTKVGQIEDVAKLCLPLPVLRQMVATLVDSMRRLDDLANQRNATIKAAEGQAEDAIQRAVGRSDGQG